MKNIYIGVDPGITGAMAVIIMPEEEISIYNYQGGEAFEALRKIFKLPNSKIKIVLEKVGSRPGNSGKSMFTFGQNYGEWIGFFKAYKVSYDLIIPTRWQKIVFDSGKRRGETRKDMSLERARRLFPKQASNLKYKKDHNIADALLIMEYCRRVNI